jgi:hypothetical protein
MKHIKTAFGKKAGGKLDRYNDRDICGKLLVNEITATPVTSTCLSASFLVIKTDHMLNKLLHTESCKSII